MQPEPIISNPSDTGVLAVKDAHGLSAGYCSQARNIAPQSQVHYPAGSISATEAFGAGFILCVPTNAPTSQGSLLDLKVVEDIRHRMTMAVALGNVSKYLSQIQDNTKRYLEYLGSQGLPEPSYDAGDGLDPGQSLPKDIIAIRDSAIEVADELHRLLLGPLGLLLSSPGDQYLLLSLQYIYRYKMAQHVPQAAAITFDNLARHCGLNINDLRRFLRVATSRHVFKEPDVGSIAHTAASRLLVDNPMLEAWILNIAEEFWPSLARAAINPRDRLIKTLTRYLDSPREKRSGGVLFVNELEDEERHAGLGNEDAARILMIILWGINSNVQMTAFWMMAHILQRPTFAGAVREEISPIMKTAESTEGSAGPILAEATQNHLIESCPLLNSAFYEVLRVCSTGSTVREVMRPVRVGNKAVPKGTKALLPQRQLLLSTEGFGPNAREVDLSRFSRDKSLERNGYYRPFGGEATLCSGRFLGKREVLAFVALALWRYEMQPVKAEEETLGVKGMPFPRLDEGKPSLGISKQVEGDDLVVKVTNRKT